MRKFFIIFVALFASTTLWAQRFQVGDLYYKVVKYGTENGGLSIIDSPGAGKTTVVLYIPEDTPAGCYAVGTINSWNSHNTDFMFTPVEGAGDSRLVACTFDYSPDMQIKVLAIPSDPNVSLGWSYQWGKNMDPNNDLMEDNVVILDGVGEFVNENSGEPKLVKLADNAVLYIEVKSWAKNPAMLHIKKTIARKKSSSDKTRYVEVTSAYEDPILESGYRLTTATIPETVEHWGVTFQVVGIGASAFSYSPITSVTIPNTVTSIEPGAFYGCTALTSVNIPNSVTSIESGAFYGCTALTSINIPKNVKYIAPMAFAGCLSRISIIVASDNSTYDSRNNCNAIIEKATNTLITGCKNTTIPNDVLHIGDYAFYGGGSSLTSMTIPASVETIGEFTFGECTRLYDIYCYAAVPPIAKQSSFSNYNAFVHIPCESQRYYVLDEIWSTFKNYECISSDYVKTDGVYTTPGSNDVTITWPTEDNANTYSIVIYKDGEVICTLTFNSNGQLLKIAFAPGREENHPAQHAELANNGYRFTVTGLEEGTDYTYTIITQDEEDNTLSTYTGEFTTKGNATAVSDIQSPKSNTRKLLRNGQFIILHNEVEYNSAGVKL